VSPREQVYEPATTPDVPSREEVVEEAVKEQRVIEEAHGGTPEADPSTVQGFNYVLLLMGAIGSLVGALAGLGTALLLRAIADAEALGTRGDSVAFPVSVAIVGAVVGALLGAYAALEREDGRIERTVRSSDAPGRGPHPSATVPSAVRDLLRLDRMAVTLGVIGVVGAFTGVTGLASVAAIVLGARARLRTRGQRGPVRRTALVGIVLGAVGVALVIGLAVYGLSIIPWDAPCDSENCRPL
jgi:hypothetical protein